MHYPHQPVLWEKTHDTVLEQALQRAYANAERAATVHGRYMFLFGLFTGFIVGAWVVLLVKLGS